MTEVTCSSCRSAFACDMIMDGNTEGCPCKQCLIIMICENTCAEFASHYNKKFGFKPTEHSVC